MKRLDFITLMLLVALTSCTAQTKKSSTSNEIQPKTNINVKKKYDKNGNVIGYDSTYTSVYSNIKGNEHLIDSIMNSFKEFNGKYPFDDQSFFNKFFSNDSTDGRKFLKNDFIYNHFRQELARMDSMFHGIGAEDEFFNKHLAPNVIK